MHIENVLLIAKEQFKLSGASVILLGRGRTYSYVTIPIVTQGLQKA